MSKDQLEYLLADLHAFTAGRAVATIDVEAERWDELAALATRVAGRTATFAEGDAEVRLRRVP